MRFRPCLSVGLLLLSAQLVRAAEPAAPPVEDVLALFKTRCVKCHGPAKREAKLNMSNATGLARGGESGPLVVGGQLETSLLWQRVAANEMPPEEPLAADEKQILKRWITAGAAGLPKPQGEADASGDHWAFAPLAAPSPPAVRDPAQAISSVDRFIIARLEAAGLSLRSPADRATLVRRVSFDLTGLPPTIAEIQAFASDSSSDAYARMVDRYLASPHYGERWGKFWLDAAGYADSNGYFNADTDRPLAYRYRDYVVRSLNADKPFNRFVLEQLAGDELAGFKPDQDATPEVISLLEATHYLRNGQDGSGESDGNAEEVRIDRYSALESAEQIVASSLLGLTFQCARCHDHKFEAVTQRDYYALQSVFYPAFNIQNWLKPNERFVYANLPGELPAWKKRGQEIDAEIQKLKADFALWVKDHRPPSDVLFQDSFDENGPPLTDNWSPTAPGDDTPGGETPVALDSPQAPGAQRRGGVLQIIESGGAGDRWLSTRQSFDWTPEEKGQWIQVTFDLVDNKLASGRAAERVGYFLALHDFNDNSPTAAGNVLFDGNPAGGATVHVDYPGTDVQTKRDVGTGKYEPAHNFGVRVTNVGKGKVRLTHLVDQVPDEKELTLQGSDLPDGGFGFEFCCGRSFIVDNVVVERSKATAEGEPKGDDSKKAADELVARQKELASGIKAAEGRRGEKPGKVSCLFERAAEPPEVFLLERGNYGTPGEKVEPAPLSALATTGSAIAPVAKLEIPSSGRRLAWARWLLEPESRQAALVARVQVNRLWQHHFGRGIVATPENLGASGALPTHPELEDFLAAELIRSGWSLKAMHRLILNSAVYQQASSADPAALARDPDNRLLWRYPLARLDAEALRDAVLATSGQLDRTLGGSYVPTKRTDAGEVVVAANAEGANRRSLYLQQRRTQTLSLLSVFDSPTIVFNCIERPASTIPLQSLSLLNSEFVVEQAGHFAARLELETPGDDPRTRVAHAFQLAVARAPSETESTAALAFLAAQRGHYAPVDANDAAAGQAAERHAWTDFCQMLLASNAFLYVE